MLSRSFRLSSEMSLVAPLKTLPNSCCLPELGEFTDPDNAHAFLLPRPEGHVWELPCYSHVHIPQMHTNMSGDCDLPLRTGTLQKLQFMSHVSFKHKL